MTDSEGTLVPSLLSLPLSSFLRLRLAERGLSRWERRGEAAAAEAVGRRARQSNLGFQRERRTQAGNDIRERPTHVHTRTHTRKSVLPRRISIGSALVFLAPLAHCRLRNLIRSSTTRSSFVTSDRSLRLARAFESDGLVGLAR